MSKQSPTKAERRSKRQESAQRKLRQRVSRDTQATLDHETHRGFKAPPPLAPQSERQADYMQSIRRNILTFGLGPAGTGKSYVAGGMAAEALLAKEIHKIIVTRPAVEAGERLGFLPGELHEKYEPYFGPFRDILEMRLGKGHVEYLVRTKIIEPTPIEFMRGRTFRECFVVVDEAQNTTPAQMKLLLTRIGEDCTVIVNGDLSQKDIPGMSGLEDAHRRLGRNKQVGTVQFERADIVRSGFVQDVVEAYSK